MSRDIAHLTPGVPDLDMWLARSEVLHRVLRPQIPDDYVAALRAILADGAEMAVLHEGGEPRALALFRAFRNTWNGYRFYIDDLVTDEAYRSAGHGKALLGWCEDHARRLGCTALTLESGTPREQAHRFYFREGMTIVVFGFLKSLA